jgi:alpha-1,3-rhamnosyl/mannosyltransferase
MTAPPLRVGVNLLWLVPGVVGGTESAAVGILGALADAPGHGIEPLLYAQPAFVKAHPDLATAFETHTMAPPAGSRIARVAVETTWLPRRVRRDRLDVVHCYGGIVPPGIRGPSVLTLHDVQPLEGEASFGRAQVRWLRTMIPRSVDAARVVLVPSSFVRDRVIDLLGADPEKIVVHPHGVPHLDDGPLDAARVDAVRRRFRLSDHVVLYPAITYPHKNHRVLVEAFSQVRDIIPNATLVLTGGAGSAEQEVVTVIERAGVGDAVRRVGRVPDRVLADLYRVADVVAFPSRYEGFGIPVLEALQVGVPVVASNTSSLPEVVGRAGQLVDPEDPLAWAASLVTAIEGGAAVDRMVAEGRQRARSLSWDKLVPMLLAAYRRAAPDQRIGES